MPSFKSASIGKTLRRLGLVTMTAIAVGSASSAFAFDESEKGEIETIVREYLLENPEIILELQEALEAKQAAQAKEQQSVMLASAREQIFNNAYDPVFGNPDGDVTIVEFFDYNCGFCRRGLADMQQILDNDPNVRFVLKEFPIFGPNSIAVHTVALAFHNIAPETYLAYHTKMMEQQGQIDEAQALAIAESFEVDMDALRDEMNNPDIIASFRQTDEIATGLGITGTPSYVVGDEIVVGALGADVLTEKLANMRECQSTTC